MEYIKVKWLHDFPEEPKLLYSEIDAERNEIRKVEIFKDGTMGYAAKNICFRSGLAGCAMPTVSEIAEDGQFKPELISREEFLEIWQKAAPSQFGGDDG